MRLIGIVNAARQGFFILAAGQHLLAPGRIDQRCAGILAHWQDAIRRNNRIFNHFQCHKPVIIGRFGIIQNGF